MNSDDHLRYPAGKFAPKESYTRSEINEYISRIEKLPAEVEALTKTFSDDQYDTRYREEGWTGRQVLHHLADSHMNAYIRFKWTLTEELPTIKAYNEKAWADTPEIKLDPSMSLLLLKALHVRWVALLKQLDEKALQRQFIHPDTKRHIALDRLIATYAWHGEHHLGHLKIIASKS